MTVSLPPPAKQTFMFGSLIEARDTVLHGALLETLRTIDPTVIASELALYAPASARAILATAGIRDETVFAVPSVITAKPTLIGYYRLLYGVSQKQFYTRATGLSRLLKLEESGQPQPGDLALLPDMCTAVNDGLGTLITTIGPAFTDLDVQQLPLLTLGAQFDGSHRNVIGQTAARGVISSIKAVVLESGTTLLSDVPGVSLSFTNSAGRQATVVLASDPDVVIREQIAPKNSILKVAIEIKGGSDNSNVHNRAGEAEKSHQKVRNLAGDFWTIISLAGVGVDALRVESPTTRQWFDVSEVVNRAGPSWEAFRVQLSVALGIALP